LFSEGACGFADSTIAAGLLAARADLELVGVDNLSRPGSELNRTRLAKMRIKLRLLDIRNASAISVIDQADWVIDAAANPSVLGGIDGKASSRQIISVCRGSCWIQLRRTDNGSGHRKPQSSLCSKRSLLARMQTQIG